MKKTQRVTRQEAATLAGVSERTISRWAAEGLIEVAYERSRTGARATYDPAEVDAARTTRRLLRAEGSGSA